MEEADALATRAAILSKRILALGTTDYLRQKYGNVYHVHLVLKTTPTSTRDEMDTVERWISHSFSGVAFDSYGNYHGQIKFSVPAQASAAEEEIHGEDSITRVDGRRGSSGVGALFSVLEENKEKMGLQFYSVRATNMDEVFLEVVREQTDYQKGSA
jgi:ATP-binding cassette, subfamily A (ABC1), member 3